MKKSQLKQQASIKFSQRIKKNINIENNSNDNFEFKIQVKKNN